MWLKTVLFKNLISLLSGTMIAQVIMIGATPILTRMYDPSYFGILGIFTALVGIAAVASSLRYELAIPQATTEHGAIDLLKLSLLIILAVFVILLILAFVASDWMNVLMNLEGHSQGEEFFYIVAATVACVGFNQALTFRNIRLSNFKTIALGKIVVAGSCVVFQFVLGALSIQAGLVYGYFVGQAMGSAYLLNNAKKWLRSSEYKFRWARICKVGKEYIDLPKYSAPGIVADQVSAAVPLLIISAAYDLATVGMLAMAHRVLGLPVALMSSSVSQLIFQRVSSNTDDHRKNITKFFGLTIACLTLVILPFALIIHYFAEDLFALVFGEVWRDAGRYASILVLASSFTFVVSPLSVVFFMKQNVRLGTSWQFLRLVTLFLVTSYASQHDFEFFLYAFVLHQLVIYGIYLTLIFYGSQENRISYNFD